MHMKKYLMKKIDKTAHFLECMDKYNYSIKGLAYYMMNRNNSQQATVIRQNEILNINTIDGYKNVGIVIQGPVVKDENFTINSVIRYRKIYPDVKIVLSTWKENLSEDEKLQLEKYDCVVLENESFGSENKGKNRKISHLNNQIFSSFEGIKYLKSVGVEYAIKIRSDLRIYRVDFVRYLYETLKVYNKNNEDRIISVAFSNSLINMPFHLSDFVWFGSIDRMYDLFSVKYRTEEELRYVQQKAEDEMFHQEHARKFQIAQKKEYESSKDFEWFNKLDFDKKFLLLNHEEIYFAYNYFYLRHKKELSLESYNDFLKNDIIIVDEYDLFVYWNKTLYSCVQSEYTDKIEKRMDHALWQHIYIEG